MDSSHGPVDLSEEQWGFLAVLAAFGMPISIDLLGSLAPLLPGPLFDLLEKAQPAGWIVRYENNRFGLGERLPEEAARRLEHINTAERLTELAAKIVAAEGAAGVGLREKLTILDKAGMILEASECEMEMAHEALKEKRMEEGYHCVENVANRLAGAANGLDRGKLFLAAVLEFSDLCFSLGQGFSGLEKFLLKALQIANSLGDKRARALLNMHLGRLYYVSDRRDKALAVFSTGFEEIEQLGDDDIGEQSAEFIGMFFLIKGLLREALDQFEKSEKFLQSLHGDFPRYSLTPLLTGYCASYAGQHHRAIGSLDSHWRIAVDRSDPALASSARAVLGTVLVWLKKYGEGMQHLQEAGKEAERVHNRLGFYLVGGGLAYGYFQQGQIGKSYETLKKTSREGMSAGLVRQFSSPMILELLYEFHRLGFEPIPELPFLPLMERLIAGINIHMRGVALRIRAKESLSRGESRSRVEKDLSESQKLLERAGDPVQLSKTLLDRAKLELLQGNRKIALEIIQRAKDTLGGYGEEFFPDEFRHLLERQENPVASKRRSEQFLERYLEMTESLYPGETESEVFSKMLTSTGRIFGAERSGLFWFASGKPTRNPELRAGCNLSRQEVGAAGFKEGMSMIQKTFRTGEPMVGRGPGGEHGDRLGPVHSSMCIPVEIGGKINGVLYYDNSYLEDAFDFPDAAIFKQMIRHTNLIIERRLHFLKLKEERNHLASQKTLLLERHRERIIHRARAMSELVKKADHVARTDSTVLILGETGTGKELLAERIHECSPRSKGPFIVVDVTTIPETLMESELFGHERGAFTGADSRKVGRLELADQGTLFLDEVGELSLPAQAKLLRVLQEKTFVRLGGTRSIKSDFRLVAATNRNLEEQAAAGRFRQDLYYRLNVIPLDLPALRERPEDIPLLADHYVKHYAGKYKRGGIGLTTEQEKALCGYSWPGNIRELKNIIERAVLLSSENQLQLHLPADIQVSRSDPFSDSPTLDEIQRRYIQYMINMKGGRIAGPGGAAEALGMKRTSLYSRMRALGMRIK